MVSPADRLGAIVATLGPDEVRVLCMIADRLATGRRQYGELRIAQDARAWTAELRAEMLDALVYDAIGKLAGERSAVADALARTQARCTELLQEVRELRAKAKGPAAEAAEPSRTAR